MSTALEQARRVVAASRSAHPRRRLNRRLNTVLSLLAEDVPMADALTTAGMTPQTLTDALQRRRQADKAAEWGFARRCQMLARKAIKEAPRVTAGELAEALRVPLEEVTAYLPPGHVLAAGPPAMPDRDWKRWARQVQRAQTRQARRRMTEVVDREVLAVVQATPGIALTDLRAAMAWELVELDGALDRLRARHRITGTRAIWPEASDGDR